MADDSTQPSVRLLSPTDFPDKSTEELLSELLNVNMAMLRTLVVIANILSSRGNDIEVEDMLGGD